MKRDACLKIESATFEPDERYLEALATCFESWGGEREFEWCFRRSFAGLVPDRYVISDDNKWIAGSAVSWRELIDAEGKERIVGIMTGSWTFPVARGRGCFKTLVERSRLACVEQGAAWLLAFVTYDNASRRVLESAGSLMIPTTYLWSPEDAGPRHVPETLPLRKLEPTADLVESWWRQRTTLDAGTNRFLYRQPQVWGSQFVDRPLPTEMLEVEGLGGLIVERHPIFDRVLAAFPIEPAGRLALEQAAWSRALREGRRFFAFTSSPGHAATLQEMCGLAGTSGFITLLPAAEEVPAGSAQWAVENGDRI